MTFGDPLTFPPYVQSPSSALIVQSNISEKAKSFVKVILWFHGSQALHLDFGDALPFPSRIEGLNYSLGKHCMHY